MWGGSEDTEDGAGREREKAMVEAKRNKVLGGSAVRRRCCRGEEEEAGGRDLTLQR